MSMQGFMAVAQSIIDVSINFDLSIFIILCFQMSEVTVSSPEGDLIDMEITQEEVSNCYALSLDKRIDEILQTFHL